MGANQTTIILVDHGDGREGALLHRHLAGEFLQAAVHYQH